MKEKDVLISHYLDMKKEAAENMMITSTRFFSLEERVFLVAADKEYKSEIDVFFFGGYEDAERTVAVFVPKIFTIKDISLYFNENKDETPFCALRISKDRFSSLSHRDYLGALMGLGIKRDVVGDIKISEDYTFAFVMRSIVPYICENLTKIGRGTVRCEVCDASDVVFDEERTEIIFSSVSSLRLDCMVSSAFNLSRSDASVFIKNGLVYVDSLPVMKNDYTVKEGAKIVLRGKGKVVLYEILGENKKGRIHLNLKRYK